MKNRNCPNKDVCWDYDASICTGCALGEKFSCLTCQIKQLKSKNASLRERLDKAYEFPVKYGDKIWVLDGKHLFNRYVWAIEIKSNGVFLSLSEKTMWYDRGIVSLSERGKTWFLDSEKELAEARLAELGGEK